MLWWAHGQALWQIYTQQNQSVKEEVKTKQKNWPLHQTVNKLEFNAQLVLLCVQSSKLKLSPFFFLFLNYTLNESIHKFIVGERGWRYMGFSKLRIWKIMENVLLLQFRTPTYSTSILSSLRLIHMPVFCEGEEQRNKYAKTKRNNKDIFLRKKTFIYIYANNDSWGKLYFIKKIMRNKTDNQKIYTTLDFWHPLSQIFH